MNQRPTVVLVNPSSSGVSLSAAILERGGAPLHVWTERFRDRHAADGNEHKLLYADDHEAVVALKEAEPVAVLAGSESGVTLANQLAIALGLPHNDPLLTDARRDKQRMLDVVGAAGLPVPVSTAVTTVDELRRALRDLPAYPVMVKPKDSAGSDGVAMCHDENEAEAAFRAIQGTTNYMGGRNTEVLVQEFVQGPQYIVDTVTVHGDHRLTDVFRYRIDNVAGKPVIRHAMLLTELTAGEQAAVDYTLQCLTALGIRTGAAHSEVRITAAGPRLIEVNSRLMGPFLPADPFSAALGYTQATRLAHAALEPDTFAELPRGYRPLRPLGQLLLRTRLTGRIAAMPGLAEIRCLPGFHSIAKLPAIGAAVSPDNPLTTATTGMAYFVHDDPAVVQASMERVHEMEAGEQIFTVV